MSYFAVVMANDDSCQTATLPEPFCLCPLARAQPYVRESFVASLSMRIEGELERAYLIEDGSATSQSLFTDEDIPDMRTHARLAQVLRLAEKHDWLICAWWAAKLSNLVWMADRNRFQETLWSQLAHDGDVSIGCLPQWLGIAQE